MRTDKPWWAQLCRAHAVMEILRGLHHIFNRRPSSDYKLLFTIIILLCQYNTFEKKCMRGVSLFLSKWGKGGGLQGRRHILHSGGRNDNCMQCVKIV